MSGLEIRRVRDPELAQAWREVHNAIIPTAPLSLADVLDRAGRHLLEVAYVDDALVGCSTVRSATADEPATVIVRVLADRRRQGLGSAILEHALAVVHDRGDGVVQTIVLESNLDGLEFAAHRGFVESDRYALDGDTLAYVHLTRATRPA